MIYLENTQEQQTVAVPVDAPAYSYRASVPSVNVDLGNYYTKQEVDEYNTYQDGRINHNWDLISHASDRIDEFSEMVSRLDADYIAENIGKIDGLGERVSEVEANNGRLWEQVAENQYNIQLLNEKAPLFVSAGALTLNLTGDQISEIQAAFRVGRPVIICGSLLTKKFAVQVTHINMNGVIYAFGDGVLYYWDAEGAYKSKELLTDAALELKLQAELLLLNGQLNSIRSRLDALEGK